MSETKNYVCGFIFFRTVLDWKYETCATAYGYKDNPYDYQTLLILKDRPEWQAGNFNGLGGKIEQGETPEQAIVREVFEESNLETNPSSWISFALMQGPNYNVHFFKHFSTWVRPWVQKTSEGLVSFPVTKLPENLIRSNRYLIPMALESDMKKAIIKTL